jgi:hypothetical protein
MMTEVTTGFAKSHASERRAGLHPCAFAIGAITSRIFQVRSFFVHDGKVEVSSARIRGLLVRPAELAGKQAAGDRAVSLKRVESGQVPELRDAEGSFLSEKRFYCLVVVGSASCGPACRNTTCDESLMSVTIRKRCDAEEFGSLTASTFRGPIA